MKIGALEQKLNDSAAPDPLFSMTIFDSSDPDWPSIPWRAAAICVGRYNSHSTSDGDICTCIPSISRWKHELTYLLPSRYYLIHLLSIIVPYIKFYHGIDSRLPYTLDCISEDSLGSELPAPARSITMEQIALDLVYHLADLQYEFDHNSGQRWPSMLSCQKKHILTFRSVCRAFRDASWIAFREVLAERIFHLNEEHLAVLSEMVRLIP